jgi:hypothetical protein
VPRQRKQQRPALEVLEGRLVLDSTIPANTLATVQGTVSSPGAVAQVSVPVTAHNINGLESIVLGTATAPAGGGGLLPQVVYVIGPDGKRLTLQPGAPFNAASHNEATAYFTDGTPGNVTIGVTGLNNTTGSFQLREYLPGDINGDGQVTLADVQLFPKSYLSQVGDANYNAAADANLNGQVGQDDARFLERNLKPLTPKIPLTVKLTLAPQFAVKGHVPSNLGGHTYFKTVTILGKTTPGSIVFTDSSLANYTFTGPAVATDARGNFSVKATNSNGINNNDFLVIDPFGQQTIMDYPIYYFPAVYSRGHPSPRPAAPAPGDQSGGD